MKLKDLLNACVSQHIRAYNGMDGKLVFDTYRNKKEYVERFKECEVDRIWTEVHTDKPSGYTQFVRQYICIFLDSREVAKVLSEKVVE